MEVADEALASKASTSTTTGEHCIINFNPTSFFLSFKFKLCYFDHCFLASINDWVNKLDGAYVNVGKFCWQLHIAWLSVAIVTTKHRYFAAEVVDLVVTFFLST